MADKTNPGVTAEQAKELACPLSRNNPSLERTCRGPHCMAWRWLEPPPRLRDPACVYSDDTDEAIENARFAEPARPEHVPPTWVWIPVTGDGDDINGGLWEEPPEIAREDNNRALAARLGCCGLVQGVPHG